MLGQAVALLALAGCASGAGGADPGPAPTADAAGLTRWMTGLVGRDRAAITRELATAAVDAAAWPGAVSAPYRGHHGRYAAAYPAATAAVVDALAAGGPIAVRRHFADDGRAAPALRRERLAVPVGATTYVIAVAGRDLPAVALWSGGRWRLLAGLDALTRDAIGARDHDCAVAYAETRDFGRCMAASAPAAVAALAGAPDDLAIACRRLIALHAAGCGGDRDSVAPPTPP